MRKSMNLSIKRKTFNIVFTFILLQTIISIFLIMNDVSLFIIICILLTGLICSIMTYTNIKRAAKRITDISDHIGKIDPRQPIAFLKTNFHEIDDLTESITTLHTMAIDSTARIAKIMNLTDLHIGFFQYDGNHSSFVFVTESLLAILGMSTDKSDLECLEVNVWNDIYRQITQKPMDKNTNLYIWHDDKNNITKRLKVHVAYSNDSDSYSGLIMDVTDDIVKQQQLEFELNHDAMTKLLNRKAFQKKAHEIIQNTPDKIGMMLFADLDNLKHVNDTYGHEMGDQYIIAASEMFAQVQYLDGISSRNSGDEFVMYIHGFDSEEEAKNKVYQFIESNFEQYLSAPDDTSIKIRCSIGISWYPKDGDNVFILKKYSDYAMYEAKNTAKGSIFEFNKDSYLKKSFLLNKNEALNQLIDEQLIDYLFQPIYDIKNKCVFGYKAFMYSQMAEFKTTNEILAIASAQSKLYQIERLAWTKALSYMQQHPKKIKGRKVLIPTVSNQLVIPKDISAIIEHYDESLLGNIIFDLNGSEVHDEDIFIEKIDYMRSVLKGQISINDFSLNYKNQNNIFPDIIKLNITMIAGIDTNPDKQLVVSNLLSYCRRKNIISLAEGVETKEEYITLSKLDVDLVIGSFIAKQDANWIDVDNDKLNESLSI